MKFSIIIPVYNEENYIVQTLKNVNVQKKKINIEIIVVNDGSTDKTLEKIQQDPTLYDQLIINKENEGKGSSIIKALSLITGDYIIIQDADLEYNPQDYSDLIEPIKVYNADIVYGSRFVGSKPKRIVYFINRIANTIITFLVNILTNINFSDVECGYKVIKSSLIKEITLKEKSFAFEIEVTMKLAKKNLKFYEVDVSYNGRTYEEGKKIKFIDGLSALFKIFYYKIFN